MIICEVYSTHIDDINQELQKSIHYGECKKQIRTTYELRHPDRIVVYIKEIVDSEQTDDYFKEMM